jgi:hypothetical protein
MGAQISANFVPPIPAFFRPNLTHKKLKKGDLERKSKGKIKKKKLRKPYNGWACRQWWWWWFGWDCSWRYGGWVGTAEPEMENHGGWVLAGDGEHIVEWRAREWSTVASL